jgi:thiol-disulfide isomerase/thioredoxin
MKKLAIVAFVCLVAALLGFVAYRLMIPRPAPPAVSTVPAVATVPGVNDGLPPGLAFTGLDGSVHRPEQWRGKLLLINFWATWCAPCLAEIPELVKLQSQYGSQGLQIVGPAMDDVDAVKAALGPLKFNYPIMIGEVDAMIATMEKLGNQAGVLPYSILVSPEGHIVDRHFGPFTPSELQALVRSRLPGAR